MDATFYEELAKNVSNGPTPYVNEAHLRAEVVEKGHVRLCLPVSEGHLNHVGMAYAGSEFVLAEIAGGTFFMATYGTDEYVPVLKGVEIKYLAPGKTDLFCEICLSEDEANQKIAEVRERGRGNYFLDVEVKDLTGTTVAEFHFNYYALPAMK